MSRVCSIHEVYCPDDVCRWCESPPAEPERLGLMQAIPDSVWSFAQNQGAQQNTTQTLTAQPCPASLHLPHHWSSTADVCERCGLFAIQIYASIPSTPCRGAP